MILTPIISINDTAIIVVRVIIVRLSILYIYMRGVKEYVVTLYIQFSFVALSRLV